MQSSKLTKKEKQENTKTKGKLQLQLAKFEELEITIGNDKQ